MKERMNTHLHRRASLVALVATSALLLTACATSPANDDSTDVAEPTTTGPRVALTYDGGLLVLDGTTLDVDADLPLEGFNRVNPAGDGQHVLVTTAEGFRVLDVGAEPELTDLVFEADTAGLVVRHGDKTILFADGSGDTTIYDTMDLLESTDELPETETVPSEAAHHGVAIELEDGTLLSTLGTAEGRTGVRVLDENREEILRSEECPSVHGEGTTQNEVAVFGCNNGVLVYDGEFTKITAPDAYGRMGNVYVTDSSPIAVGDYNSDPDSEGSLLSEIATVDTVAKTMTVIDLPEGVQYTWRDVVRTSDDEATILGTDGSLHVLDLASGEITASYPVIAPWEGPAEWQDAHPALAVVDGVAYVTEPASDSIHSVDLATGDVTGSAELPGTPNEIVVVG
jgi:glutamine cyclotransferase